MPAEVLSYFLKNSDRRIRLGFQVVLQCAPFLKGLKVSCVITWIRSSTHRWENSLMVWA